MVAAGAIALVVAACDPEGLAGLVHDAGTQLAPLVERAAGQAHVAPDEVQKLADTWSDRLSGALSDLAQRVGEADDDAKGPARKVILGSFCDALNKAKAIRGVPAEADLEQVIGQNLVRQGFPSTPQADVQELAGRLHDAIQADLEGNEINDPIGDASRATMCAAADLP